MTNINKSLLYDIIELMPDDKNFFKRLNWLLHNRDIVTKYTYHKLAAVVYIYNIYGLIPSITWITSDRFRGKGIATELTKKILKNHSFLIAHCKNIPSIKVARKCGFKRLFRSYFF